MRYVPIGALTTATVIQKPERSVTFLGSVTFREACWNVLKSNAAEFDIKMLDVYSIWTDEEFAHYLNSSVCSGVFLHMNSYCTLGGPLSATRFPLILNAMGLIVSERSYVKDEMEYESLAEFLPSEDIPRWFNEILSMPLYQRQSIASARAEQFKRRFEPSRLFQKAGIYDLLQGLLHHGVTVVDIPPEADPPVLSVTIQVTRTDNGTPPDFELRSSQREDAVGAAQVLWNLLY